jgi:hypothetical protein
MSIAYDINTYNNTSFILDVTWETFSGASSGTATPVNLTGYTALLQVRQYAGAPTTLFSVGSFPASGITLNSPSTGGIAININPVNYIGIGTGNFYYDLLMIDSSSNQTVILEGTFTLNPGVSQNAAVPPVPEPIPSSTVNYLTVNTELESLGTSLLDNVIISGGTVNNVSIGSSVAGPGYFTTLNVSSSGSIAYLTIVNEAFLPVDTFGITAASGTNSTQIATTAFVQTAIDAALASYYPTSINNVPIGTTGPSTGNFTSLSAQSLTVSNAATLANANLYNAVLTGAPTAPTAASGTNNTQIASTAFVQNAVQNSVAGVSSFNSRTGAVSLLSTDIDNALGFTLINPASAAITSGSINGATIGNSNPSSGAFTTLSASSTVSGAGFTTLLSPYALLASPTFTGTPVAPTATTGTNTTQLATTAFVINETSSLLSGYALLASPSFSGTPTAPTASTGTDTTQIATTAFVVNEANSLLSNYAPLLSPALTGTPTAPTATPGTNNTQLATTAFVGTALNSIQFETATYYSIVQSSGTVTVDASASYTIGSISITFPSTSKSGAFRIRCILNSNGHVIQTGLDGTSVVRQNITSIISDNIGNQYGGAFWYLTSGYSNDGWGFNDTLLPATTYTPGGTYVFTYTITSAGGNSDAFDLEQCMASISVIEA